ncbi:MAG TPA: redox-regulated ATPase YchF, partial [Acidimicrobiia bacterium]
MEHLGLVGLPDSGHAQLFSALTGLDAPSGFETTKGVAPLPDDRVDRLADMSQSKKRVHATFEIDFIPGLAPGGKPGEGLGSRLLGELRDSDALLMVVRADDGDPAEALGSLELELVLSDLASVEQRLAKQRRALKGDATLAAEVTALDRAEAVLGDGTPVYRSDLSAEERDQLGPVFLLTNKPMLVVVNVPVDALDRVDELAAAFGPDALAVCVEIEGDPDVARAAPDERAELLADL